MLCQQQSEGKYFFLFLLVDTGKYMPVTGHVKFCTGKSVLETRVSVRVF